MTVPDSSGGTHVVTFPVTAIISVGTGTDSYTPPANVTSVQATCSPSPVSAGATAQCLAAVTGSGSYSSAVTWSAAAGSVDASGMFTAPTATGTVAITATSVQDSSKAATFNVSVVSGSPVIPANAIYADLIHPVSPVNPWKACVHDLGTPGDANCSNNYPVTGIFEDDTRTFAMTYTGAGGVRWADTFANDTATTHYVYDTVVQSPDWSHVANLELDINQVKADGNTAILGTQCGSYSKTWEITRIGSDGKWHWFPTNVFCNPLTWTPNTPHHVRIFGTMTASGVSTYIGVELDGQYSAFTNGTAATGKDLAWGVGVNLANFQIDGLGASGTATISSDRLTIIRW